MFSTSIHASGGKIKLFIHGKMVYNMHKEDDDMKRVFLTVLDGAGVGYLPDAAQYGDEGS